MFNPEDDRPTKLREIILKYARIAFDNLGIF